MTDRPRPREVAHPTPFTYLKVAAVLGILTGLEVAVFYIDVLEPAFLPIFLLLSVVKFVLVALFYMHLKFDSRLFSGVFVGGLMLAILVAVTLMALFQVLSAVAGPSEGEVLAGGAEPPANGASAPPTLPPAEVTTEASVPSDPVEYGQQIFLNAPASVGAQALWCSQCHAIEGVAIGLIGPDQSHIATDAATRKPGMSAEEYIRESIVAPESFVAVGVERAVTGLMTTAITSGLTDEQVDALVAFLMTLE